MISKHFASQHRRYRYISLSHSFFIANIDSPSSAERAQYYISRGHTPGD